MTGSREEIAPQIAMEGQLESAAASLDRGAGGGNADQETMSQIYPKPSGISQEVRETVLSSEGQDKSRERETSKPGVRRDEIEAMSDEQDKSPKLEGLRGKRPGQQVAGKEKKRLKTSLCVHFQQKQCRYGESCRFAHSADELEHSGAASKDEERQNLENAATSGKSMLEEDPFAQYGLLNKCVINLPKPWQTADFKGFVDSLNLKHMFIKKQKGVILGFLTFENEADSNAAVSLLSIQSLRGQQLKVSEARPRRYERKAMVQRGGLAEPANGHPRNESSEGDKMETDKGTNASENQNGNGVGDHSKGETAAYDEDLRKDIRDAVTPWWKVDYAEQLQRKEAAIGQLLKKLARKARKSVPYKAPLPDWIRNSKKHKGMACPLLGIVASPMIEGYRNKCEFTVGLGMDVQRTVGFQLGLYREGYTAIASPKDCRNVSPVSKAYVEIVQDFVRTSELSVWDKKDNVGVWRMVTVREGRAAQEHDSGGAPIEEVLLMVQVSAQSAPSDEALQSEYQRLKETVVSGAAKQSPPLPLTYLVVQVHEGVSNAAPPDSTQIVLVNNRTKPHGRPDAEEPSEAAHIFERMCGLRFRLSLSAFFQVNTPAAEKLYRLAGCWAGLNSRSLLFDVCCGTGTIGLTLASTVGKVIGIDMVAPAIEDAKENARLNKITNCDFVCGRAEAVLGQLLSQYASKVAPVEGAASGTANGARSADVAASEDLARVEAADVAAPGAALGAQSSDVAAAKAIDDVAAAEPSTSTGARDLAADPPEADEATSLAGNSTPSEMDGETKGKPVAVEGETGPSEQKAGSKVSQDLANGKGGALYSDVVAIVDPPRCGLHPTVLKALAANERLRRLVYVSCNPESLISNVLELCASNSGGYQGREAARGPPPFKPVKAMVVDLFPHTPHCEMVMLLER